MGHFPKDAEWSQSLRKGLGSGSGGIVFEGRAFSLFLTTHRPSGP